MLALTLFHTSIPVLSAEFVDFLKIDLHLWYLPFLENGTTEVYR